jgi:hypothetical protein
MKRSGPLTRRTRLARTPIKKRGRGTRFRVSGKPDEAYREWIRSLPCVVSGKRGVEACHVRSRGAGGCDRENLVPLTPELHREQHRIGIKSFQAKYETDLRVHAERLWAHHQTQEGR